MADRELARGDCLVESSKAKLNLLFMNAQAPYLGHEKSTVLQYKLSPHRLNRKYMYTFLFAIAMTFLSPALVDRTAEAVGPGHPDKFCDHVVAGILQYCLEQDRTALVNVECSIDPDAIRLSGVIHATQGLMQSRFDDVVAQTIDLCGMRPLQYDSTWEIHDKVVRFEHATNDASDEGLCGKLTAVDQVSPTNQTQRPSENNVTKGVAFGYATDELVALQALRGLNHL